MTDKELADRVVALGVGAVLDDGITYLLVSDDGGYAFNPVTTFVRDWRVAGALMERCKADMKGPVTIYVSTPSNQDFHVRAFDGLRGYESESESLPRAVVEACVKALNGEQEVSDE